jgi:hypothetical protein
MDTLHIATFIKFVNDSATGTQFGRVVSIHHPTTGIGELHFVVFYGDQ